MNEPRPIQKAKPKRGCLFYGVIAFICMPILLILLLVGVLFARDRAAKRRVDAKLQELRAQNLPVDEPSLQTYYESLTSSENTSAWINLIGALAEPRFAEQGSELIQGVPMFDGEVDSEIPAAKEAWPNEEAVRKFVEETQDLYDKSIELSFRQLDTSAKPVRFPIVFNSFNTSLEHAQQLRQVARLMLVHCQLAQFDGDSEKVQESLNGLFGCSHVLAGDPFLIGQLVANAIEGMSLQQLRLALKHGALEEEAIQELLPVLISRSGISDRWKTALYGERAWVMPVFAGGAAAKAAVGRSLPFRNNDALYYLEYTEDILSVDYEDIDSFVENLDRVEQQLTTGLRKNPISIFDTFLTGMTAPSISSVGQSFVRNAVGYRQATLASAVRLFQLENDRFPETLAEIESDTIVLKNLMPPGGKPFGYEIDATNGNAVIWGLDVRFADEVSDERPPPAEPPANDDNTVWELLPLN